MPKIIQLSPHIANLIAAGEVVERHRPFRISGWQPSE